MLFLSLQTVTAVTGQEMTVFRYIGPSGFLYKKILAALVFPLHAAMKTLITFYLHIYRKRGRNIYQPQITQKQGAQSLLPLAVGSKMSSCLLYFITSLDLQLL